MSNFKDKEMETTPVMIASFGSGTNASSGMILTNLVQEFLNTIP